MNAVYELVSRTRTARGVLRDVQSGKILAEKKETLAGVNQFAQNISFSVKEAAKKITDNPNFVKWFGNSKILDKSGNPLILYRGTGEDKNIFDGHSYWTPNSKYAESFGYGQKSIYPAYIKIENLLDLTQLTVEEISAKKIELVIKELIGAKNVPLGIGFDLGYTAPAWMHLNNANKEVLGEWLNNNGFDGVRLVEQRTPRSGNPPVSSYIVFEPTQIKSIYNTGSFGITEPDIRFQTKPTYAETQEPVTKEDWIANRKEKKDIKLTLLTNVKRVASEITEGVDKYLGVISTRLGNVSPKLKNKLRQLDLDIGVNHAKDVKSVEPLLRKAIKMNRDDIIDWDYARKNSVVGKIDELVAKYGMQREYELYRKTLSNIREEGLDVGLEIGEIEEYAPRILKDDKGFLKAIGKPEYRPLYSDQLKKRAAELNMTVDAMPLDMKADIISNIILGGRTGLAGVPATKHRRLY